MADFLQQVIVGLTALAGANVRPRWQPKSPLLPPFGTDWAAFGVTLQKPDAFAYEFFQDAVGDTAYRQEELEMLISWYGPNAGKYASIWSAGLQVGQNREQLFQSGFGIIEVQPPRRVPEMIKGQWWNRVDQLTRFRRAEARTFNVLSLTAAQGTLEAEAAKSVITVPLVVNNS